MIFEMMGYCRRGSLDQYCFISGSRLTPISILTAKNFSNSCSLSSCQLLHRRVQQSPVWSANAFVWVTTSCWISLVKSLRKSSISVPENGSLQPLRVSSKSMTCALKLGSVSHCQGAVDAVNPDGVSAVNARSYIQSCYCLKFKCGSKIKISYHQKLRQDQESDRLPPPRSHFYHSFLRFPCRESWKVDLKIRIFGIHT